MKLVQLAEGYDTPKTKTRRSWCLPNGTFLDVGFCQHGEVAAKHFNIMDHLGMQTALKAGWVRCIVDGSYFCVYSLREIPWTMSQTRALFDESEAKGLRLFDERVNRDLTK